MIDNSVHGAPASSAAPVRAPRKPWSWRRRLFLAGSGLCLVMIVLLLWWQFSQLADPGGPPDEVWCRNVRRFPVRDRVRIVLARLEQLNPGWINEQPDFTEPEVLKLELSSDHLSDIRPLAALSSLKVLSLTGSKAGAGELADLEPLAGMKLIRLDLSRNSGIRILEPLRQMPLFRLDLSDTSVMSLDDLKGMPLTDLLIARTSVTDLGPLRTLHRLRRLDCAGCVIAGLEPLLETPLEDLQIDFRREKDSAVLRNIPTLQTVNSVSVNVIWKKTPAPQKGGKS